jgi:hypothetical protein
MVDKKVNKCQYWSLYEPYPCEYWDGGNTVCTYEVDTSNPNDSLPTEFPHCNLIGTRASCNKFLSTGTGVKPRCVLPDPRRHVCNRETGRKWVSTVSGTSDYDFSPITGYNEGECDGGGTDTTCSGYSPEHMGFGRLVPSDSEDLDTFVDGKFSSIKDFDLRVPINYAVYNLMAILSKCRWWTGDYVGFTINNETTLVELGGTWECTHPEDTSMFSSFSFDYGAPCNGCKASCPYYTGICWEYCIDEYMAPGDPILAEQVHELRYYHRENQWAISSLEAYFGDKGYIYSWDASIIENKKSKSLLGKVSYTLNSDGNIEEYQIPSYKTYMEKFDLFTPEREPLILTEGTEVDTSVVSYPSLVREIKRLPLPPIVKNRFYNDGIYNYFETPLLKDETDLLIFGKSFYDANVYPIYAINISDEEIYPLFPKELYIYDYMIDAELNLGGNAYEEFYNNIDNTFRTLQAIAPQKISTNELAEYSTFIITAQASLGAKIYNGTNYNTILVLQYSPDGLVYTKVKFKCTFVGGVLTQSKFEVLGDMGEMTTPFDYTASFNAHVNKNGKMQFYYNPISSGGIITESRYMYNDLYMPKKYSSTDIVPDEPILYKGHKLYEVSNSLYVLQHGDTTVSGSEESSVEYYPLSSDGYVLIDIDHPDLNNVFFPWEAEEINIVYSPVVSAGAPPSSFAPEDCEMEIVCHGSDGKLGPSQAIIKPKDPSKFRSICGNTTIELKNIKYWEKRSYDQEPDTIGGWEATLFEEDGIVCNYSKDTATYSFGDSGTNLHTLTDFQFTMVPSVVINNMAGKPFTQFRTKPIGWVKQFYCPDVEIEYRWGANYTKWTNDPLCNCCGPWKKVNPEPSSDSFQPNCGDHDLSFFDNKGPLWWPYTTCSTYQTYDIISNLDYYSVDVIGLFKQEDEDGNKIHGNHDMRMLGPANNIAWTGYGCNFLIPCTCDWRTYNKNKLGDNNFIGWARIRGLVPYEDMAIWNGNNDTLPKFGNTNRPQMFYYRTIDKWQYEYSTDGGQKWNVSWKLMPAAMEFSKVDFTSEYEPMWDYGGSSEGPNIVNPLGIFITNDLNGESIDETIEYNVRYSFDDIFNCRFAINGISYPSITGTYSNAKKDGKINPWYEFKSAPAALGDKQIQWAWQEPWKDLVRNTSKTFDDKINKDAFIEFFEKYKIGDVSVKGPFINEDDGLKGSLLFLDLNYPDYKYDFKAQEFRQSLDEGFHTINFEAPKKDENTGEYIGYMGLSIDSGPKRGLKIDGSWISSEDVDEDEDNFEVFNVELYDQCTGIDNPTEPTDGELKVWSEDVTLFSKSYESDESGSDDREEEAENDDRMVKTFTVDSGLLSDETIEVKTYFRRGLDVKLNDALDGSSLPLILSEVVQYNRTGLDSEVVCGITDTEFIAYEFDSIKRTIGKLEVSYKYGMEEITAPTATTSGTYTFYHKPQISVFASEDGLTKGTQLYTDSGMDLYKHSDGENMEVKLTTLTWNNTIDYIFNGKIGLYIELRITPTSEELDSLSSADKTFYNTNINLVGIESESIYDEVITDAKENIYAWERKYYISYGNYGDAPPQGKNPDKQVLWPEDTYIRSTVYNKDDIDGVYNVDGSGEDGFVMTSKVRGGRFYEIYEDKTTLSGDVHVLEGEQKKLYDKATSINPEDISMNNVISPGLSELLKSSNLTYNSAVTFLIHNSLILDLASINSFPPMSGEGHEYVPSKPSQSNCSGGGRGPCSAANIPADYFYYSFEPLDPEAEKNYSGIGHSSAFTSFYGGTLAMMQRTALAEALMGVFGPKYGAASGDSNWVNAEAMTSMLFFNLTPRSYDTSVSVPSVSYNAQYFAYSSHWHNAYFNTAGIA